MGTGDAFAICCLRVATGFFTRFSRPASSRFRDAGRSHARISLRRVLMHLLFSVLFCVAWATCGQILRFVLILIFAPEIYQTAMQNGAAQFWRQFGVEWLSWIFTTLPFGAAVYLCVVGIEHATRYFIEAREREVQVARLSEQLSSARFAALQAQLNPHFLFNTLNTIAVLVRDNDRAGRCAYRRTSERSVATHAHSSSRK